MSLGETASSADLGGSSKYSNANFEDRSGEGFHVNSNWTWVSRSQEAGVFRTRELCSDPQKGVGLIFPNQNVDIEWQHKRNR